MALLAPADENRLRTEFGRLTRRVHLLFFTQTLGCDTCLQARQVVDELPPLSDRIVVDEINFILEPDRAAAYGIDRVPAIAVAVEAESAGDPPAAADAAAAGDAAAAPPLIDTRMRFLGTPGGYEFMSLVQAVLLAGGAGSQLSETSRQRLAALTSPLTMHVFTTPTCPHCPKAVMLAHEMAFASPQVTAYAVEATEYPDLARRFRVTGVPKTVVNDTIEILGALPEEAFINEALGSGR